ncbi:hypothetical protein-transmembrane prediction [Rhodopirellula baltica SH 1]|uniref:Uncharacterized protein n=1 Tax=Rhodopirellula baltica (strain DSM 10527 / NCIMB 13988 / SH1) TaxID=243090 RepID=Q7UJ70_RHOBA|nr:hypothetical protein-transmembrane prediction [Rhodopirellula baltica SH 1]
MLMVEIRFFELKPVSIPNGGDGNFVRVVREMNCPVFVVFMSPIILFDPFKVLPPIFGRFPLPKRSHDRVSA